jgi:hypothetical protein
MRRSKRQLSVALATAACLATAAWLAGAGSAAAQRVGVFFDEQATVCNAPITSFGSVHAYIYVFPPPTLAMSGVALRLQLPSNVEVDARDQVTFPHGLVFSETGSLEGGLILRFYPCITSGQPLRIAEFGMVDLNSPSAGENLVLHFVGTPIDTMVAAKVPRLLVCNPDDPEGQLGVVDAPSVDAILNCTQNCYCTTALVPRTWGAVKSLYREP